MDQDWIFKAWMESQPENKFKVLYLGNWETNDAVYKREDIEAMLRRGEISEGRAQEMLRMCWAVNRKGEKVVARGEASV